MIAINNAEARSAAQARLFRQTHICPSTKTISLVCKGYVVDHIKPLCAGGLDDPSNMQYQAKRASYRKDIQERAYCRKLKSMSMRDLSVKN